MVDADDWRKADFDDMRDFRRRVHGLLPRLFDRVRMQQHSIALAFVEYFE